MGVFTTQRMMISITFDFKRQYFIFWGVYNISISVACSSIIILLEVVLFVCVRVLGLIGFVFWHIVVTFIVFVVLWRVSSLLLSLIL
jgi:hypothetical protein